MQKYMMFVKHAEAENIGPIPPALGQAMEQFVTEGLKSGALKDTAGLRPTREGYSIRSKGGKLQITDGPFTESKEIVGGYALVEAETPEQARQIAHDFMEIHRQHWPDFECACEVRALDG
jgi:hypothetical protein